MKKIILILIILPLFAIGQTFDVPRADADTFVSGAGKIWYNGTQFSSGKDILINPGALGYLYLNTTGYYIAATSNLLIYNSPATHLFRIAGNYKFQLNAGDFSPYSDLLTTLGQTNARYLALFSRNLMDTTGVTYFDDNKSPSAALLHLNYGTNVVTVRGTEINPKGTIADNDSTPSVAGGNVWQYNGTANSVSVDALDDHQVGAFYYIIGNSDTYTITVVNGSVGGGDSFDLDGDIGNWVGGVRDVLVLYCIAADTFIEISRIND